MATVSHYVAGLVGRTPRVLAARPSLHSRSTRWTSSSTLNGMSLIQVSEMFNHGFKPGFFGEDMQTRRKCLMDMRTAYCAKMLEECAIPHTTLEALRDPAYLPSRVEVLNAFKMDLPAINSEEEVASRADANLEADLTLMTQIAAKPASERTFEENFQHEFGLVAFSPLFAFCERYGIYEFLTVEYVDALATYLGERQAALPQGLRDRPILEVAAGSGRLAHFLTQRNINVLATDSGSWGLNQPFKVTSIAHDAALTRYQPAVVLCSWMPENTDFTAPWRAQHSVQEYVLIGAANSGLSGLPWETWGFASPHLPEELSPDKVARLHRSADPKAKTMMSFQKAFEATQRGQLPPYQLEGFQKQRLDCSKFQICRRDAGPTAWGHSETYSFRRATQR
eukprot:TRINITY_DN14046_c0_g1_i2.p1 TRINITY_DN14046_c0_g1~~TRINITY_DN14046_c0_g1_i2.p1  ORF type:complete len:409 (+),score=31.72 TRINITY_DN14046_c0_g1_i2:45-1229(+)